MTLSYPLLQVSSLRNIFDRTSCAKCLRNTSRLNISVILRYSDSVRNLSYFLFPKVLVWLSSVIHFKKYFSPQPSSIGSASVKRLVDLQNMILFFICKMSTFQHSYQSLTENIGEIKYTFWGAKYRYIVIHPHNAYEHSAYSFKMRTCNYKILKIMKITEV